MSKILVLYHANCADGFCAAWTARRFHGEENVELVPVKYDDPPPDVTDRDVMILDFSYRRSIAEDLASKARCLLILDHHKSAEKELAGLPFAQFDMQRSGGRMTWDWLYPGVPAPWLVEYTEDRDLWRWRLPRSREVSAYLQSSERTFEAWDVIGEYFAPSDEMVSQGAAVLRYQGQLVDAAVKDAYEMELCGHRVLVVNSTVLQSEIGEALARGRPFGATYSVDAQGRRTWSLRSREGGVDVSELARAQGGGGHAQAAGFRERV